MPTGLSGVLRPLSRRRGHAYGRPERSRCGSPRWTPSGWRARSAAPCVLRTNGVATYVCHGLFVGPDDGSESARPPSLGRQP